MALGWIYVLSNGSMPGLVKIGQSAADPELRAQNLHTTGLPEAFHVEYKGLFDNYVQLERKVYEELTYCRHAKQREFFFISAKEVVKQIKTLSLSSVKFETCNFTQLGATEVCKPIQKIELPWVRLEQARKSAHSLSKHVEPELRRFADCPKCGKIIPHSTSLCPRCNFAIPEI